jgi:large subunit ribosomal protein L13
MKYTIDAQGKKLGRIASQAAAMLMGKNTTTFTKNTVADSTVEVINVSKADITAHKKEKDNYVTFTGFRGGLNNETLGHMINRRGYGEVFRKAIYRMLPNNKLRDLRIKNLII